MQAASVYRMAVHAPNEFRPDQRCFTRAEESRNVAEKYIDGEGLVRSVVNPLKHLGRIPLDSGKPEGQYFAATMFQAYYGLTKVWGSRYREMHDNSTVNLRRVHGYSELFI